jgi:hypothetical protein
MQRTTMPRPRRETPRRPKSRHPHLEIMEDRLLMSSVPSNGFIPGLVPAKYLTPSFIDSYLQALRAALVKTGPPSNNQNQPAFDISNPNFTQINQDGFGDNMNSYSWSMAWFKGKLYVGTMRGNAGASLVDPTIQYKNNDLGAEIWAYTPETGTWEKVYKSPLIPTSSGQNVWADNGFRDMFVYTDPSTGQETLFVAGVVFPSAAPGVNVRPRLLYTDGGEFKEVPQGFLGDLDSAHGVDSLRAMAEYNGKLYLTAGSLLGEGFIVESADPTPGDNNTFSNFSRVSPQGMLAFELQVYNNYLYVGTTAASGGYSVYKMDADHIFTPVVTNGANGSDIQGNPPSAVLSMAVFKDKLYVGSQVDLIRIDADDNWQLIVGNPRETPLGHMDPLSGLTGGFGNPFTNHIWRLQEYGGQLYAGTWDTAVYVQTALQNVENLGPYVNVIRRGAPAIGPYANVQAGFDLWTSGDGASWTRTTHTGFGDPYNAGVRSLLATPIGLAVGSINAQEGTQVWIKRR